MHLERESVWKSVLQKKKVQLVGSTISFYVNVIWKHDSKFLVSLTMSLITKLITTKFNFTKNIFQVRIIKWKNNNKFEMRALQNGSIFQD